VILGAVNDGVTDTIARLRGSGARMQKVRLGGIGTGDLEHSLVNPLLIPDQAILFLDGWLAVGKTGPYRVSWRSPRGEWIDGKPVSSSPATVSEADRRRALTRAFASIDVSQLSTSVLADWPTELPPFLDDALLTVPSGHVMVRRTPAGSGTVTQYDVFDRRGVLVARVEVPSDSRIVTVGSRGAYVTKSGDDGTLLLSRHSFPKIP
jgi:hypothetical protein